jgi:hypothetical protein
MLVAFLRAANHLEELGDLVEGLPLDYYVLL